MNHFIPFRNHFFTSIRLRWKQTLCILILLCITAVGCQIIVSKKHTQSPILWGRWQCSEQPELSLLIEPDKFTINGLRLSYEFTEPQILFPTKEQPQRFVLDGGPLGVLSGSLFWEQEVLVLDIDGDRRHFVAAESQSSAS